MVTIEPTIKIYDDEGNLSRAYDKAINKMIDKTYDINLERFDFDEVAKGKSKELDNLVAKLCKESGLGSKDIYTMLLDRFEAEYDVPVDFVVYLGKDWEDNFEESKKSSRKSMKESISSRDLNALIGIMFAEEETGLQSKKLNLMIKYVNHIPQLMDKKGKIFAMGYNMIIDYIKNSKENFEIVSLEYIESKKSVRKLMKESKTSNLQTAWDNDDENLFASISNWLYINNKISRKEYKDLEEIVDNWDEYQKENPNAKIIWGDIEVPIEESKKSVRKSMKESRGTILDKEFYDLVDEGYIYDEDENGMNMSYGEYDAVANDLWEVLANELKHYRDFPSAYDAYMKILDNTSDDAKMFMGVSDDDYFYFEIDEDEGTYRCDGEVPSVLEKLFKEFQKETDLKIA